jgi:hypothetical protein
MKKSKQESKTYWNDNHPNQKLKDWTCDKLTEATTKQEPNEEWWHKNKKWALLNGIIGLWYGKFNNGDNIKSSFQNNMVHGYQRLSDFKQMATEIGAPTEVLNFLSKESTKKSQYEEALDKTVIWVVKWQTTKILQKN